MEFYPDFGLAVLFEGGIRLNYIVYFIRILV